MYALDGLVHDAVPHSQHLLPRMLLAQEVEKLASSLFHLSNCLDVVGPRAVFQVRNEQSREATPIAFAKQGCRFDGFSMWLGNDAASVDGALQIACEEGIDLFAAHPFGKFASLLHTTLSQSSLRLSLHDLVHVVFGLSVTYEIQRCDDILNSFHVFGR